MGVDILAIGENNRKKQEEAGKISIMQPQPAWKQKETYYASMADQPEAKMTVNPLDRQVEIGLGAKITPMTRKQKQEYADSLPEYKWNMMQRYKAEGYSFEASKELVDQADELANPNGGGINKYKDYEAKEQYYTKSGSWLNEPLDPDSTLYKVGTFLQKIGFNDEEKNPLNKLARDYISRYADEREAIDTVLDNKETGLAERFGRWLQKSLLSAEGGIISGLGKFGNAVSGVEDIKQSAMNAVLDRVILGYDTDLDFYRQDDRRLDEYLWEGTSGGLNTIFWAWAPKVMMAFSALGETKPGEWTMEKADNLMKSIINLGLKTSGIKQYYAGLDEQGQEDMVDTLSTLGWMEFAKRTGKWTGKVRNTKVGREYENIKNQFKSALKRGVEGAKEQTKAEINNVKEATDLYNEGGKKIGNIGPEGETGVGKSVSRIVKRGVDEFKQSFIDRYNARHGGKVAEPGTVEPGEPVTGKPNNDNKGVVDKVKDVVDTKITGLTPEERTRVVNDPYTKEKWEKARTMLETAGIPLEEAFITEQLYNEVGDKILQVFDEWEDKLTNTLPEYKALRSLNTTYNLIEATPLLTDLLLKNDITQDPVSGELDFSNSKFVSDADMRSVQRAIDMIYKDINTLVTPRQYLNLRDKLDQLAKYTTMDASRGQALIRQIRRTLDGIAKKEIPGLKELDEVTHKYFNEIAELKDGWVYKESTRKGQVRNNFYSIIKNLTGHNRKVMLQRLEKYYPGIGEEIEAIHITEKLVRLYNKSPQMIKALGIGGGLGGVASGSVVNAILWSIFGALIEDNVINPMAKTLRRKKIDKLLSEMSPEAKAKLEEIALRQTYAKEMSEEDKRILEGVTEVIRQENERGLSEEAIREREKRTKKIDNALPGVQPDIVDENGNITLGRGNVISPEKGPGRSRRLTRINEINLRKADITPDKQALDLQEKLDIDTETAQDIQNRMNEFITEIGANEEGSIGGREVNYEKFSTASLEKLMDNENLPKTEKDKIEAILVDRGAEQEIADAEALDREFAYRINKIEEAEQRVGKVGRNKVSKEVAERQQNKVDTDRERIKEEMGERYAGQGITLDKAWIEDKYAELVGKPADYINSYKRSTAYKNETAEREILNSLIEGWSKQPKFVRDMNETQLANRQDFINKVELQNGYKLETTDYNDRYILEDNGTIVDRGAIKYLEDGRIEITAQTFDGIKESGLLDYLPDNTEIKEAGSNLWMTARELKGTPLSDTFVIGSEGKIIPISEVQNYYDFADKTPIDKFNGELTKQQIQEGKDLYQLASESLTPETENEIIEARGKFLTLNQRPGYTKALGLDQGEVNKTIMSWQWMSPELKKFVDKIHAKTDPKYRFMGISNWIERDNPWRGIDSLKFLTEDVKAVDKDPNIRSYELEIRDTLDGIMLGNSKLSYETLRIRLTHEEELNAFNKELRDKKAVGEFFPDIDMLVAGEGKETVRHEEGHYISSLLGRKILGNRKAFDKGIRNATSRDWERWWSYRYKDPEVGEFHEKILKLVESLDKSMTPQMKNDNHIMSDGTVMRDYRANPDEKRARFWSASIEFTKRIAQTGKIPTKAFKSEHGDEYSLKQYESLIEILQEYQRLEDKGLFYEVEVPDETRVNKRTGLKDIQQKSLFDQEKSPYNRELTPDQKQVRAARMIDTWKDIVSGFDVEKMLDLYDDDIAERSAILGENGLSYGPNAIIDFGLTLKALSKDKDFMEGLKIRVDRLKKAKDKGQYASEIPPKLYKVLKGIKNQKPGTRNEGGVYIPVKVRNEELIEPIRRWFIEHDISRQWEMDKFKDNYSPDTIYWKQQMSDRFNRIPLSEFKELEKYAQNLAKSEDINYKEPFEKYSNIQVNGMSIDRFIDTIGNGIGKTFAEKRIREIADDMWSDVMDPMGDIFQSALAGATEPLTPARFNEFVGHIYYDLGQTYKSNIKEWSKTVEDEIKARADHMGITLNRKKVIPEQKLQGLGAKLKEMLAMGKDLGEYITNEMEFDYNPTRNERIRDLVSGAYENIQKGEATKDIETTKQLVALSNMNVENFRKQIEGFGGKSPMPSIAVTDVNVPHTAFGDLTVIFGRDTVDPQIDPRNKLYASDSWTVTFPDLEEIGGFHYKEATELRDLLKDKINEIDSLTLAEGGLDSATIDLLADRIVNEILENGSDAEYLAGYFDVSETSVENAVDEIGLDRTENEGLYRDLEHIVEEYVKGHQIRQVIPARYFKGRVRYQDFNAIDEIVDKVYDNLPEKGKQKLIDEGYDEVRNEDDPNSYDFKEGISRDLTDIIERIEDRPNNTPTEAGREYRDLLVDEYGFDRLLATQIAEDIFGQIEAERLTPEGFAAKLADYMPLNDGDMGFDFGEMDEHNLDAMNIDVESMNRQVGRRILEERDGQKNNVDGPQAMNKILDTLLDEWEENTHEIIENYVTVDLREKDLGDNPSFKEEKEWMEKFGKKNIEDIMGGVDASLTDMKLWVKDIANQEMLVEEMNRDRPLTPENVLEAMKGQGGPRRDNAEGTLRDLVGVEGKEFTDIEQVRGKNLAKTTHNDRTGDLSAIEERYDTIIDEIRSMFTESDPDVPMEMSTQVVRQEIAWNYDPDLETFRSNLEEENPMWEMVPDDYLQGIIDAVEMGKQVPVRFSESKPERVVDLFKEVQYILVPKESYKETQRIVKGTPLEGKVYMYDRSGFKSERSNKIKQLQRRYGNIFFSMGGLIMPIAMLYLMMEQEEGQA